MYILHSEEKNTKFTCKIGTFWEMRTSVSGPHDLNLGLRGLRFVFKVEIKCLD